MAKKQNKNEASHKSVGLLYIVTLQDHILGKESNKKTTNDRCNEYMLKFAPQSYLCYIRQTTW